MRIAGQHVAQGIGRPVASRRQRRPQNASAPPARPVPTVSRSPPSQGGGATLGFVRSVGGAVPLKTASPRRRSRRPLRRVEALVNVDVFSPSLLLGVTLIGSGVSLFAIRSSSPRLSRDSDVVLSSLVIVTGGALVFQGWRLDPLLLLCQLMTAGVATAFALETLDHRRQSLDRPEPPPRPEERSRDETFFYDLPPEGPELPRPRQSLNDYLSSRPSWSVEDGEADPYDADDEEWQTPNQEDATTLQAVEDWE